MLKIKINLLVELYPAQKISKANQVQNPQLHLRLKQLQKNPTLHPQMKRLRKKQRSSRKNLRLRKRLRRKFRLHSNHPKKRRKKSHR